jgi:hypothetical protein
VEGPISALVRRNLAELCHLANIPLRTSITEEAGQRGSPPESDCESEFESESLSIPGEATLKQSQLQSAMDNETTSSSKSSSSNSSSRSYNPSSTSNMFGNRYGTSHTRVGPTGRRVNAEHTKIDSENNTRAAALAAAAARQVCIL